MTTSMWSEEAVQAAATAMHPDCDRSACPAHEVWVHQAREALKAAEPYARAVGRREASEEITKAIERRRLSRRHRWLKHHRWSGEAEAFWSTGMWDAHRIAYRFAREIGKGDKR